MVDFSSLILFFFPDYVQGTKKPASVDRRRAWVFLEISLAVLLQAMAVRRHGGSMMVVMAVVAEALHLSQSVRGDGVRCQIH
jgi:hypothetical protein